MEVLILILMVIVIGVAMFVVPRWRVSRATTEVIQVFQEHNATNIKNAKTSDELGFKQRGMLDGIFTRRDYKPYALSGLMRAEIVQVTEDGKLYLSEEKLATSGFYKSQSGFR